MDRFLAPSLAIALLLFWTAVGVAILDGLDAGLERGRQLLAAPAVGAAISMLAVFWLNWAGLPVRSFAASLTAALAAAAGARLWMRRPNVPRADVVAAALPLAAAFLLIGWPLFSLGFNWLSYSNDDMATYSLMAARLLDHGLVEPPTPAAIRAGADLTANFALFEFSFGRPGSQLLLAWVAGLVPRSVVEIYMPVTVAMHVTLVAAAGALVWRESAQRQPALATCWLVAASALTTLGTVTQLLPQVFGLALGCVLVLFVWDIQRPPFGLGRIVVAGAIGAAFLIVYPEFAPLIGVPLCVRVLALGFRRGERRPLWSIAVIAGLGVLLAAPYAERFFPYLVRQSRQGFGSIPGFELFPYFRLSTAFAHLWGLLPIARRVVEPLLSAAIIAGAVCFAAIWVLLVGPLRRGDAAPGVLLFMLLFSLVLFVRGNGFGLFKLAMYAQPFMLGTAALALVPADGRAYARERRLAILLVGVLGLPAQAFYVRSSVDPSLARTEIQDQFTAMNDLRRLGGFRGSSLDVDLPVTSTAKIAALFLRDVPLRFIGLRESFRPRADVTVVPRSLRHAAAELTALAVAQAGTRQEFSLRDPAQPTKTDAFYLAERPAAESGADRGCDGVLTGMAVQSVVNRTTTGAGGGTFRLASCPQIANHLAFVSSTLGRNYYFGGADPVGLYALERDYFFPDRTFAGVGRYLLFEVLRPTPSARVVVDFTSSLKSDGANLLPAVAAIGAGRTSLGTVGRGSARLYSAPISPQWIGGHAYIAIDFGVEGSQYPDTRRGLMRWLGRDVSIDPRRLVGLVRNISLVSDEEYRRMTPPSQVSRFPDDLGAPNVEYSGLYEDGWVAETMRLVLKRTTVGSARLTIKGTLLPGASHDAGDTVAVDIDGVRVWSEHRDPGPFTFEVSVPPGAGDRMTVGLRFASARPLSDRDLRLASARIEYVGLSQ